MVREDNLEATCGGMYLYTVENVFKFTENTTKEMEYRNVLATICQKMFVFPIYFFVIFFC